MRKKQILFGLSMLSAMGPLASACAVSTTEESDVAAEAPGVDPAAVHCNQDQKAIHPPAWPSGCEICVPKWFTPWTSSCKAGGVDCQTYGSGGNTYKADCSAEYKAGG